MSNRRRPRKILPPIPTRPAPASTAAHTPIRNVRVDDHLWTSARAVARRRRESLSAVIRAALERYVASGADDPDPR